ncbi:hypothetical protein ABCR94_16985 [Streptomyces sp. 21So2-11]
MSCQVLESATQRRSKAGKKALDRRLPNREPKLYEVFAKLQAKHGSIPET